MGLPRILAVFTGGTISMRRVPGRGAVPAHSGREILARVPGIAETAEVEVEDFDRLPGPHWTAARMADLARLLERRLEEGRFEGAAVTHGTDTLEETAYFLDLALPTDLPVAVTGAMRTADDMGFDGPANLLDAIRVAACPAARGRGVLVVLNDEIHAAREVAKTHTEAFEAFASPQTGLVGIADSTGVHFTRAPDIRERILAAHPEARVELVPAALGADGRMLACALAGGARGIVIEGLGRGNLPPGFLPPLREAVAAGIPVVVASRCPRGRTAPRYGYEGGGVTLREAGAIFSGDLSARKARIKLMLLLGAGRDPAAIRAAFEPAGC